MIIAYDPKCTEYGTEGHPERPERLLNAHDHLKDRHEFRKPEPATEEDLLRAHIRPHLENVRTGRHFDGDCPDYPGIYDYAKLSAGGAILAMENNGFSLMRPPGHHAAASRVAGFCYFNNIAVAVRTSGKRTLIIDFDGHHGDGTQSIFMNDDQVIFLSLHSSPTYPGTGRASENNCHNYPLPFSCGEQKYLDTLDGALDKIDLNDIEQVAVSAGFDAYKDDPLASLGLETESYRKIGERIKSLGKPTFSVLEGGYDVHALGPNIGAYLDGLEKG